MTSRAKTYSAMNTTPLIHACLTDPSSRSFANSLNYCSRRLLGTGFLCGGLLRGGLLREGTLCRGLLDGGTRCGRCIRGWGPCGQRTFRRFNLNIGAVHESLLFLAQSFVFARCHRNPRSCPRSTTIASRSDHMSGLSEARA